MCGVVGFIGVPSRANRLVFEDMLCMDVKRGPHSTGIAVANRKEAETIKDAVLPWDLIREQEYKDKVIGKNWPMMMGHNRWATIGGVTKANAHPFHHQHVLLMHNGTLEKGSEIPWDKFDTDSEALTHMIAEHGIKASYDKLLGAWTIVWWDQKEHNLNVITNGLRPFHFIAAIDRKTVFFASEEWTMRFAAEARGVALEKAYYHLTSHHHFKFWINRKGTVEYGSEELEPRKIPFTTGYYPKQRGGRLVGDKWVWDDEDQGMMQYLGGGYTAGRNLPTITPDGNKKVHIIDERGKILSHNHSTETHGLASQQFVTEDGYKAIHADSNCVLCGCSMAGEYRTALIIDPETVACGTCHDFCNLNGVQLT